MFAITCNGCGEEVFPDDPSELPEGWKVTFQPIADRYLCPICAEEY